jgi:SAM-dependent methyltransferase
VPPKRSLIDRLTGPSARTWWLQKVRPHDLLQPSTMTFPDRHPALFDTLQSLLAPVAQPAILSFGCSTGEEIFSLAQRFPTARLRGIDINGACIAKARRALGAAPDPRIDFVCAASAAKEPAQHYDAVLALSVLRHGRLDAEQPRDCAAILPFARFAGAVASLDACLRPGGVLMIWASHFRFLDTLVATDYTAIGEMNRQAHLPLYGPDNQRCAPQATEPVLFRKRGV